MCTLLLGYGQAVGTDVLRVLVLLRAAPIIIGGTRAWFGWDGGSPGLLSQLLIGKCWGLLAQT